MFMSCRQLGVESDCKFCYNILWLPVVRLRKGMEIT